MKVMDKVSSKDVLGVYSGPEGDLWELVMGEQIHVGGFASSMALAEKAGIGSGMSGVDLCCCNGAGMRFLVRFRNVKQMTGVDFTEHVLERARQRCKEEGMCDRLQFKLADVMDTGLPAGKVDFVWGEDAWCYVEDKERLIAEAARLVKPGGLIAFTDWIETSKAMSVAEAERFLRFMKFPNIESLAGYTCLLEKNGCQVSCAEDTGQYASHVDLYLDMLNKQLTYDALKVIGFDMDLMQAMGGEMAFMQKLAHEGKIAQGRFVARKK